MLKSIALPVAPKYSSAHSSLALLTTYTLKSAQHPDQGSTLQIQALIFWHICIHLAQEACPERFRDKLDVHVHVGPNVHDIHSDSLLAHKLCKTLHRN